MEMALQWPLGEYRTLSPIVNAWPPTWVSTPRLFPCRWAAAPPQLAGTGVWRRHSVSCFPRTWLPSPASPSGAHNWGEAGLWPGEFASLEALSK